VLKQNSSSGLFCVKRDQLCRKRRKSITTDLQKKTNNRNAYHRTTLVLQGCCSVRPAKEMHILEYACIPAYYSRPTKKTHTIEQDCCCRVVAAETHTRDAYSRICNYYSRLTKETHILEDRCSWGRVPLGSSTI